MFPTGAAGAGLLLLRVSIAVSLLTDGTAHCALVKSFGIFIVFSLTATFLCLGFLTPYFSITCCLLALATLWATGRPADLHLVLSIANGIALSMLGPGAYSLDARIFGRRLLSVSSRKRPNAE
jgi:hypothetical protein